MQDDRINSLQRAFWRGDSPHGDLPSEDLWPTESRGDGSIKKNNLRTGAAQGKSSLIRKASCRLCGFPNDLTAVNHDGGSIDGEGAGGAITTATVSAPTSAPPSITGEVYTHTENIGTQAVRKNAGCCLCFSKNSTGIRLDVQTTSDAWDRLRPLGFIFLMGIISQIINI